MAFLGFNKADKLFYLIYGNVLLILVLLYALIAPIFMDSLDPDAYKVATDQIFYAIFCSGWVLVLYPLIGKFKKSFLNPEKFVIIIASVKMVTIIILDLVGVFQGRVNFTTDYNYAENYLSDGYSEFYYPPACNIYFVFMLIINPWKNTLLYRIITLFWEVGVYYMIIKISKIKELNISSNSLANALIYQTISVIPLFVVIFNAKFDLFCIFISMVGIYFFFKKRWGLSAFILVFCGFFKIYAFLWIAGILLFYLKEKKYKEFKGYLLAIILSGIIQYSTFYLVEGFQFLSNLLQFGWHFTVWHEFYNLNWTYYLKFLNIPFSNFIPIILIILALFVYVWREKKIGLNFFINIIIILLFFYPSVNGHYIIWITPLIALALMSDIKRIKKATFLHDALHATIEIHAVTWIIIFGLMNFTKIDKSEGTQIVLLLITIRALMLPSMLYAFYKFTTIKFSKLSLTRKVKERTIIDKKNKKNEIKDVPG